MSSRVCLTSELEYRTLLLDTNVGSQGSWLTAPPKNVWANIVDEEAVGDLLVRTGALDGNGSSNCKQTHLVSMPTSDGQRLQECSACRLAELVKLKLSRKAAGHHAMHGPEMTCSMQTGQVII